MSTDLATSFPPLSQQPPPSASKAAPTKGVGKVARAQQPKPTRQARTLDEIMAEERIMQEIREGYEALGVEFDPSNADMVQRIAEILGFSVIDTTLL